mmetsp:Transcript_24695/g.58398  ORF Transcript_24695/g.58398 Transcript_24695/m.58398 type:complete len:974 (+) Transcript_24695:152-3073(+)|eukprot:CAMPEP_0172382370 /NCGR_PEP_ID=MMETSP1061-20121228/313_1 /TAXON_ID=37318 /ORGANISM="Pseudo-nitzschia pungens, Strain cf. pungens" /LENGTH=973 /DNA_ID=CAMNT_0013110215 /DNA_START=149 /DNA_END=3070 /DNA_ORIENTATION=-
MASLEQVVSETLSPIKDVRKNAEKVLTDSTRTPGFLLQLLQLIANANANVTVRQAAAVYYKNAVKTAWDDSKELEERKNIVISPQDRTTMKTNLVELMCTVPPQIQAQVSESISIIAEVDYPEKWDDLLPKLVAKFDSADASVVNGVLKTADSIFRRFCHVQRSDALYGVIIYTLNHIQEPVLKLLMQTATQADALVNDPNQLKLKMETLRLVTSILYSLVYQDLPEYYEDNMTHLMGVLKKYLQYDNPALVDNDEEDEPGPIDKLQSAIIDILKLFIERDEEPFQSFIPEFTTLIWNLLISKTTYPKHDQVVVTSMKYLNILVGRQIYRDLFKETATLQQIVANIVIPNMTIRESDEENFEDNPQEYIMTELEGSDNESRRRGSRELLGAMCRQFEAQTTTICSEHMTRMLADFSADKGKWVAKDTAISLMLGIVIRKQSSRGVSELNHNVNLMEFFTNNIFPELQDKDESSRPMVKASCLNFVCTFRNQFSAEQYNQLLPLLIFHLSSSYVAVHSFAANTIEQVLRNKGKDASGASFDKVTQASFQPFLQSLFEGLFHIVDNVVLNENEYVMKCIMTTLDKAGENVIPVTGIVFEKLSTALERVCKNPRNPGFNHNLFESIAILVKSICAKDTSHMTQLEQMLFPPFQTILQMDILEFSPYVFQILAQLLEFRPREAGLGEAYTSLFAPLLTATLWEKTGNVPGLTRLVQAYLKQAAPYVVSNNHLMPILGIFQKLNTSKATEGSAFDLLSSLVQYAPRESIADHLKTIFQLLLTRLQSTKSNLYPVRFNQFLALFSGLYGGQYLSDILDKIQPNIILMLLQQVWLPKVKGCASNKVQAKAQVVGLTKLLSDLSGKMLGTDQGKMVFAQAVIAVISILTSSTFSKEEKDIDDERPMVYDATFSQLKYAQQPPDDAFKAVPDPTDFFFGTLRTLSASNPGVLPQLLQQGLSSDVKLATSFQSMCQSKGFNLA